MPRSVPFSVLYAEIAYFLAVILISMFVITYVIVWVESKTRPRKSDWLERFAPWIVAWGTLAAAATLSLHWWLTSLFAGFLVCLGLQVWYENYQKRRWRRKSDEIFGRKPKP